MCHHLGWYWKRWSASSSRLALPSRHRHLSGPTHIHHTHISCYPVALIASGHPSKQEHLHMANSSWRDWVNQPELVSDVDLWQRVVTLASHRSRLALLDVCSSTRATVLREAPKAKLSLDLSAAIPSPLPLLQLRSSGRTKPTTLDIVAYVDGADERVATLQASTNVQYILYPLAGCPAITHLNLRSVMINTRLLEAVQGLPALTTLDLQEAIAPRLPFRYEPARLPRGLTNLSFSIRDEGLQERDELGGTLGSIMCGFLAQDTIADLGISSYETDMLGEREHLGEALMVVASGGVQTTALRKLSMDFVTMSDEDLQTLFTIAPLLEEVEVLRVDLYHGEVGEDEIRWCKLTVQEFDLSHVLGLPLGGTQNLEIHITNCHGGDPHICVQQGIDWPEDEIRSCIEHLTVPAAGKRRVVLVGSGRDGGAYEWNNEFENYTLVLPTVLPVLQLSKAPASRVDIHNDAVLDVDGLVQALGQLPSVKQLQLSPYEKTWYEQVDGADNGTAMLLARLPLHIEQVHLTAYCYNEDTETQTVELYKCMVRHASKVPGRQVCPLRLCLSGLHDEGKGRTLGRGEGKAVRAEVERCIAQGDMGVVMENAWF